MFRALKKSKIGQSIVEYTVLFCLILSALMIMQFYVKRCYEGRIKREVDEVGMQYSPGHTASTTITKTSTYSDSRTGVESDNIPLGMTVTQSQTTNAFSKTEGVDAFADEK
ncbi:MAG: hypothetical protein HY761_06770 [Candidatus Omnitrophica bacterium]|nr:hypothetical protein [Candidatus Omnitrophota bacterium]